MNVMMKCFAQGGQGISRIEVGVVVANPVLICGRSTVIRGTTNHVTSVTASSVNCRMKR